MNMIDIYIKKQDQKAEREFIVKRLKEIFTIVREFERNFLAHTKSNYKLGSGFPKCLCFPRILEPCLNRENFSFGDISRIGRFGNAKFGDLITFQILPSHQSTYTGNVIIPSYLFDEMEIEELQKKVHEWIKQEIFEWYTSFNDWYTNDKI